VLQRHGRSRARLEPGMQLVHLADPEEPRRAAFEQQPRRTDQDHIREPKVEIQQQRSAKAREPVTPH